MQHNTAQLNKYSTTATQQIAMQRNKTDTTQRITTTQHNIMDYNARQRNTTDTTHKNSPQHKKREKNNAHMLNKPVGATLSLTINSTDKNGQKTLQVYASVTR